MKYCPRLVMVGVAFVCTSAFGAPEPAERIEGFDKVLPEEFRPREAPSARPPEHIEPKSQDRDRKLYDDEDTRHLVETVMMVRLSEELNLDDEQTILLVRRLRQLKEEIGALRKARGDLYRRLKDAVRDKASDAEIRSCLDALLEHDRKMETFKQDRAKELGEGLTTRQQAQLYIFLSEFENDMRQLIHRAQDRGGWRGRNGDWHGGRVDPEREEGDHDSVNDSSTGSNTSGNDSQ